MDTAIPLQEARRRILGQVPALQPIELPLQEAYGCVAAAEVVAEFDIPPFSYARADGFAARSADIVAATPETPVTLRMAGWAVVGRPPEVTVGWGEAVRVTTGAPIPAGADCVVPVGNYAFEDQSVRVLQPVQGGSGVRPAGEDLRAGSMLVPAGRRLSAPEMGILAAAGHGSTLAYPKVRVGVISVGELTEPGAAVALGQVRDASSYMLLGALRDLGAVPYRIGIVSDLEAELRETVMTGTLRSDAFVVSGGPEGVEPIATALAGLGDMRTYRAAVHPGASFVFGLVEGKPFFSLSGLPVSGFVSFELFVRPAMLKMMGRRDLHRPEVEATLDEAITGPPGNTLFVLARVAHRDGAWRCRPTGPLGASLLGSVVEANGLVVLPPGEGRLEAGSRVRVHILRPLER